MENWATVENVGETSMDLVVVDLLEAYLKDKNCN